MKQAGSSPLVAAGLACALLGLGFVIGVGYHTAENGPPPATTSPVAPTPAHEGEPGVVPPGLRPPLVKGLRASPSGDRLVFSAVYDDPPRATRFLYDMKSGKCSSADTPRGWQDYALQFSADGSKILFDREKIPRAVAKTTAGLYQQNVWAGAGEPTSLQAAEKLPAAEKSISGMWADDGQLLVKTRSEPKSIYAADGHLRLIDHANGTYLQNRVVRENRANVFYVVRNDGAASAPYALFRVSAADVARRLCPPFAGEVAWCYVSEDAHWLIVCRRHSGTTDWLWTLYAVSPRQARVVSERTVPGDVISVFWSPGGKLVLGASGASLWAIGIPSLKWWRIGTRTNWQADDATWTKRDKEVVVAAHGSLWRVDVIAGQAQRIWQFPQVYWK